LTAEQVARLASCGRGVRFAAGTLIFREGGVADALYLLRGGRVALEQHIPGRGAVQVENLVAGDILGLSWLFPDAHWALDARAVEPVEAFRLDAGCVRARMGEDPALGYALAGWLVEQLYLRLMRVRLQRMDVYGGGVIGGEGGGEVGDGRVERAGG
jgi:CRP-like cAMP-binding protein